MTEKDVCRAHTFPSMGCNFSFCMDFLHSSWLLNVEKRINKALSMQSEQFLLLFSFFGWSSFKTQVKIEFWPLVNGGQLVVE